MELSDHLWALLRVCQFSGQHLVDWPFKEGCGESVKERVQKRESKSKSAKYIERENQKYHGKAVNSILFEEREEPCYKRGL